MSVPSGALGILVAALGGAAVGVERQRSANSGGPRPRFGGVRTFTLLGGLAGLAGWFATRGLLSVALVLAAGAVLLVVVSYVSSSRGGLDATTEVAGLVVIGAGFASGTGALALASGIVAVSTLLLVEKSRLHALVGRIDDEEMRAAARFGVMAVVILPLLPTGPYGPFGIKPRELWLLVLLFTGLSFVGYVARRILGPRLGYPLAGLLGGIVSSTSTTFAFARLSRRNEDQSVPLAVGTVAACTMLFPRVMAATFVLEYHVALALLPYFVTPFLLGVVALVFWWRASRTWVAQEEVTNPLQVGPALQMAVTFQVVLLLVSLVRGTFGATGLLASGAVLGLTDVDALTISMAKSAASGTAVRVAAQAIAIGVLANCVLKAAVAVVLGTRRFWRTAAPAVAAMAAAIAIALGIAFTR